MRSMHGHESMHACTKILQKMIVDMELNQLKTAKEYQKMLIHNDVSAVRRQILITNFVRVMKDDKKIIIVTTIDNCPYNNMHTHVIRAWYLGRN